jgi:class 3 adenylate cyclase
VGSPLAFGAALLVWLVAFGLCLDDVFRGTPTQPLLLARDPAGGGAPIVTAVRSGVSATDVAPGDRLVSVAGNELSGRWLWEWQAAFDQLPGGTRATPIQVERDGVLREAEISLPPSTRLWPRLVASAAFVACAIVLFAARGAGPVRLLFAWTYVMTAVFLACFFVGGRLENAAGWLVQGASLATLAPLSLQSFLRLDPSADRSVWLGRASWLFALFGPLDLSRFTGVPLSSQAGALGLAVLTVPFLASVAFVLTRAYRHSDLLARRRLKWVFLGIYLALVIAGLPEIFAARTPAAGALFSVFISGIGLLPVCVMIGIVRHNFLDIDRVLSATASITIGVGLLLTVTQFALPPLADAIARDSGLHEASIRIVLIILLVALMVPIAAFLGRGVDRLFFASRLALERHVGELVQELSVCETPQALAQALVDGLRQAFEPRRCVVFTRSGDVLSPAFAAPAEGSVPPSFAVESPLAAALREQPGPLARDAASEAFASLGSFQRAVLETLGAEVVLPVRRAGQLAAFVCLGAKSSGDAYTSTDRSYLALIADKLGSELLRFDQQQTLAASRDLQQRFRRYVPGTLAERLDRGGALDLGEIEVSVLFVDIRGYSHFAESLRPEEIFTVVNAYTELVSAVVRRHGGTVVEFNGDGMMAVFGAPDPMSEKEAAAVAAGCRIVTDLPSLPGARGSLSAGVGIATGKAFVGNVQAVDRMIWTALGNTTNLASRLQQLTRELPAAVVIDRPTFEHAGREAAAFLPYIGAPIRGRDEREDLYLLPLRGAA